MALGTRFLAQPPSPEAAWYWEVPQTLEVSDEEYARQLADEWSIPLAIISVIVSSFNGKDSDVLEAVELFDTYAEEHAVNLFSITAPEVIRILCELCPTDAKKIRNRNSQVRWTLH